VNLSKSPSIPSHIRPEHWYEWTVSSGVDPEIVSLNVRSLSDIEVDPFTHEITTPIHDLLNWKYARFGQQVKDSLRGWMVSGVEGWARFKPDSDTPVMDRQKGEPAKYLSPKAQASRLILLRVPRSIWERVSEQCGIPIEPTDTDFWQWVRDRNVPRILIEGEKKAGYLLTLGYAAIALPGITGGVRTKDERGDYCPAFLIPDLAAIATPGAPFSICFDFENRSKQLRQLMREKQKLSRLLTARTGITPTDIRLPGPEKGADDFGVARGKEAFQQVCRQAKTLAAWKVWEYGRFSYKPNLKLNQRYLGELQIPDYAKLVVLKSPKGTGKTQSYQSLAHAATREGRRVLVPVHRTQLGQAICDRIGIPFLTEVGAAEERDLLGYGLCVDSLHGDSQARFNPNEWANSLIILDEWEQILWHLLNADTEVKKHRLEILANFKQLLTSVLESEHGQIVLADADLTDTSIRFLQELTGIHIKPWVVVNEWQPDTEAWEVHAYTQPKPFQCLSTLIEHLHQGEKVFITTHSQKVEKTWSSRTLEGLIKHLFPEKKVLRIDGETIRNPEHAAFGCISRLNEVLPGFDVVIASPAIETGVSIDFRGHFTAVFAFFQGVTSAETARQALARVREPIPRHVWITPRGVAEVGNGSSSPLSLFAAQKQLAKKNFWLNQLDQTLLDEDDTPLNSLIALRCWSKIACRINFSRSIYRQSVLEGLQAEGHRVREVEDSPVDPYLPELLTQIRDRQYSEHCTAITEQSLISDSEREVLRQKKQKTDTECYKERKYDLHQRYQVEVTPDLIAKDDEGWYPKIRLCYYFTLGRQFLQNRDRKKLESELQQGQVWAPTLNRSLLGVQIGFLELLNLKALLNPETVWKGGNKADGYMTASPELLQLKAMAQANSWEIKAALGVTITLDKPDYPIAPVQIAKILLGKLGLTLSYLGRFGCRGDRQRCYQFIPATDGRKEVYAQWQARDQAREDGAVSTPSTDSNNRDWTPGGGV
jgi:hypothetical protein